MPYADPQKRKECLARWNAAHPTYRVEYRQKPEAKRRHSARQTLRQQVDPNARLLNNLRSRVYCALKGKNKSAATQQLLGCSIAELRAWLSGWFEGGMTWDNYGDWHVDHNRPCATFDLTSPIEQARCFHYLNLRPLWASDNCSKKATYVV